MWSEMMQFNTANLFKINIQYMLYIKNILFYFPSRTIGGTQYLYSRCANYLALHSPYKIYYVDLNDGFAASNLLNSKVNIIEKTESITQLPDDTLCVIQLNFIDSVFQKIKPGNNCHFVFWAITPNSITKKIQLKFIPVLTKTERDNVGKALKCLSDKCNIIYMDHENYHINSRCFGYDIEPTYVPVPIDDKYVVKSVTGQSLHEDKFRFAWLGRLDSDKLPTLITFMNELELVKDKCTNLSIIGNGDSIDYLKSVTPKYNYPIVFTGPMINEDLNKYIDNEIDVGLGMGLSALEFAKRGKPTILRGFMPKPIDGGILDNYIFVSQIYKFTPGTPYVPVSGQADFATLLINLQNDYKNIATACHEYTCRSHVPEVTCNYLLSVIQKYVCDEETENSLSTCIEILGKARQRSKMLLSIKHFFSR